MTSFLVVEYRDDDTTVENTFTAREFAIWLQYLKPTCKLSSFNQRGIKYQFTICDAVVSVERL